MLVSMVSVDLVVVNIGCDVTKRKNILLVFKCYLSIQPSRAKLRFISHFDCLSKS